MDLSVSKKVSYQGVSKGIQPESNMIQVIGVVVDGDIDAESHTMYSS